MDILNSYHHPTAPMEEHLVQVRMIMVVDMVVLVAAQMLQQIPAEVDRVVQMEAREAEIQLMEKEEITVKVIPLVILANPPGNEMQVAEVADVEMVQVEHQTTRKAQEPVPFPEVDMEVVALMMVTAATAPFLSDTMPTSNYGYL